MSSISPGHLRKYAAISSSEQRQTYKNDFNAEYGEYRDLHARIERITRHFTQLDSQLKQLSQGSEEYKVWEEKSVAEKRQGIGWLQRVEMEIVMLVYPGYKLEQEWVFQPSVC